MAKFFGVKTVNGYDYLELERIGAKFGEGMIATADIKIGKVTYDPLASEAKKARSNKWEALPFVGYQYISGLRDFTLFSRHNSNAQAQTGLS